MFAAVTDEGEELPAETFQKLMLLPSSQCLPQALSDCQQLDTPLINAQNDIVKMVNNRNLMFFEEEVNKFDLWADDLKYGLEQCIKEIDQQIKEVRRFAKIASTLEEKLSFQKQQQQELERSRNKQRKDLFDRQDDIDERRESLIGQLESKLNQKTSIEDLFIIHWTV